MTMLASRSSTSTTTDGERPRLNLRTLGALLLGAPVALAIWGAVMLVLTLFQPAGRPVAVYAPGGAAAAIAAVVAADGYLLEVRGGTVIAIARDDGFVPRLYRSGAALVLAADVGGCIVPPGTRA